MYLYPVYIPYYKKNFYFKEFTNDHYKKLVKTITSDDIYCFNKYINVLLSELCDELDVNILPAYDKFYIMVILRILNIGSDLEFSYEKEENNFYKFKIDLIGIINQLDEYDINYDLNIDIKDFSISTSLPKDFISSGNILDTSLNCLTTVKLNGKNIDVTSCSLTEKEEIVNSLPGDILPTLIKRLKEFDDIVSKQPIIDIKIDEDLPFDKQMFLSFFNNSFYEIIKLIYNTQLKDFYSYEFMLIKKFKFNYDHICKMTPAELQVYFNVISEDIAREKAEQEKQKQSDQYYQPPAGSDLSNFYPGEKS